MRGVVREMIFQCKTCGNDFEYPKNHYNSKRYCSKLCQSEYSEKTNRARKDEFALKEKIAGNIIEYELYPEKDQYRRVFYHKDGSITYGKWLQDERI